MPIAHSGTGPESTSGMPYAKYLKLIKAQILSRHLALLMPRLQCYHSIAQGTVTSAAILYLNVPPSFTAQKPHAPVSSATKCRCTWELDCGQCLALLLLLPSRYKLLHSMQMHCRASLNLKALPTGLQQTCLHPCIMHANVQKLTQMHDVIIVTTMSVCVTMCVMF